MAPLASPPPVLRFQSFFLMFFAPLLEFLARQQHPDTAWLKLANLVFMLGLGPFDWRLNRQMKHLSDAGVAQGA